MTHHENKYFCTLMQCVTVAPLILVAMGSEAAPVEPLQPALDASAQTPEAASNASSLWRSLMLSQGSTRHDYRELDLLGRVKWLDSETGSIPSSKLTLRWRGRLAQALPELALQASVNYAQGQTDYNGYLQDGATLTPYSARTGNTQQALRLRVGVPLNAFTEQPWAQHIAPYVEQSWQRWQRNLVLYGETFTWQTTTIGVMAACPLAEMGLPKLVRFTLEADLATGRSRNTRMAAPALSFLADLGETAEQTAVLALHYAVTSTWLLGLRLEAQRSNFGASASAASLQYPGGSNSTRNVAASLAHQF